jgi:hypothetical protein
MEHKGNGMANHYYREEAERARKSTDDRQWPWWDKPEEERIDY